MLRKEMSLIQIDESDLLAANEQCGSRWSKREVRKGNRALRMRKALVKNALPAATEPGGRGIV